MLVWDLIFCSLQPDPKRQKKSWEDREMIKKKQKYLSCRARRLHPGPIQQTDIIILAEKAILIQSLTLLPPTHFDKTVSAFSISSPKSKFIYTC